MSLAIWWIRRDLRLDDNQALAGALAHGQGVVPLFILDQRLLNSSYASEQRNAFLFAGLRSLDLELRQLGSRLIVRRGDPATVLAEVMQESGATAVYAEEDISPFARRRDQQVQAELILHLMPGLSVHPPDMVLKSDGTPYTVFTPFSKAWKALPPAKASDLVTKPESLVTPNDLASLDLPVKPTRAESVPFFAGSAQAQARLAAFASGQQPPIFGYDQQRNRPDIAGTSLLSPYLRFGMISMRQAVVAAYQAAASAPDKSSLKGAETWLNELIWREFYLSILYHYPHVRQGSFRPQYDAIAWRNNQPEFDDWCHGRTGYPIVDAAMRQLSTSGWMHNRTRMITASFLVKDLLIDWRWGERWFMQHLVDGDPSANNGGWQWTAGTGTDAAPYFRIFNPVTQSKKFDPDGQYIRGWLPELANVPEKYIHEPWLMPQDVQAKSGCRIGRDYPEPIVDHGLARERTLAAYKAVSQN